MAGRADVVHLLKEECESLNINFRTQRGPASTALHLAAERGHVECVMALIECGASLEAVDRRCRTAKDVAAENGRKDVVYTIIVAEVEWAVCLGNVGRMKEVGFTVDVLCVVCSKIKNFPLVEVQYHIYRDLA